MKYLCLHTLLFLKMMKETGQEERLTVWIRPKKSEPPVEQPGTRWDDLLSASAPAARQQEEPLSVQAVLERMRALVQAEDRANPLTDDALAKLLLPAICMDYFGGRSVASVVGTLYSGAAVGNLLGPVLAGAVFDVSGNYLSVMAVCGALSLSATWASRQMKRSGQARY